MGTSTEKSNKSRKASSEQGGREPSALATSRAVDVSCGLVQLIKAGFVFEGGKEVQDARVNKAKEHVTLQTPKQQHRDHVYVCDTCCMRFRPSENNDTSCPIHDEAGTESQVNCLLLICHPLKVMPGETGLSTVDTITEMGFDEEFDEEELQEEANQLLSRIDHQTCNTGSFSDKYGDEYHGCTQEELIILGLVSGSDSECDYHSDY